MDMHVGCTEDMSKNGFSIFITGRYIGKCLRTYFEKEINLSIVV